MKMIHFNPELSHDEQRQFFVEKTDIKKDLTIREITFSNEKDCMLYLEDILQLYPSISVKYTEPISDFEDTEKYTDLRDRVDEAVKQYLDFPEYILEKLKKQKSNMRSCSLCKSSVNRDNFVKKIEHRLENIIESAKEQNLKLEDFLNFKKRAISCPICDSENFIISETEEAKLKSLRNKVFETEKRLKEEEMAFQIKAGQKIIGVMAYKEETPKEEIY